MINSYQIRNEEELEKVLLLPFFRDKISNKAYYRERTRLLSQKSEPLLDVTKIQEAEYAKKVKEELKDEVRQEIIQDREEKILKLDEKIEAKNEELLSIPSILDQEDYDVPETPEKEDIAESETTYAPWWEKLGLREDPFHLLEGLDQMITSFITK